MSLKFVVPCNVWSCSVHVLCGYPAEEADKVYKKKIFDTEELGENVGIWDAFCLRTNQSKSVVLWYKAKHPDISSVVHESIHAAYHILEMSGVDLTPNNHEPLAYLADWITSMTVWEIKKRTGRKGRAKGKKA